MTQTFKRIRFATWFSKTWANLTRTYLGILSRNGTKVTNNKERRTTCGLSGMDTLRGRIRSIHFIGKFTFYLHILNGMFLVHAMKDS